MQRHGAPHWHRILKAGSGFGMLLLLLTCGTYSYRHETCTNGICTTVDKRCVDYRCEITTCTRGNCRTERVYEGSDSNKVAQGPSPQKPRPELRALPAPMDVPRVGERSDRDPSPTDSNSGLVRLLEFAASYVPAESSPPETMGSVLSSVRVASSLTSRELELFDEKTRMSGSGVTPTLSFSQQISKEWFVSVFGSRGDSINYDRTSTGSMGALLRDQTRTIQTMGGFRIGLGPMDYLARSSGELSLGVESNHQSGPFLALGMRRPIYSETTHAFSPMELYQGSGTISFSTSGMLFRWGMSQTGRRFGGYFLMEAQTISGRLNLMSRSLSWMQNGSSMAAQPREMTAIRFSHLSGGMMTMEFGMIFKISEKVGLKAGVYMQGADIEYGVPGGYYYNKGSWTDVGTAVQMTSAATRAKEGFAGLVFASVTRL